MTLGDLRPAPPTSLAAPSRRLSRDRPVLPHRPDTRQPGQAHAEKLVRAHYPPARGDTVLIPNRHQQPPHREEDPPRPVPAPRQLAVDQHGQWQQQEYLI